MPRVLRKRAACNSRRFTRDTRPSVPGWLQRRLLQRRLQRDEAITRGEALEVELRKLTGDSSKARVFVCVCVCSMTCACVCVCLFLSRSHAYETYSTWSAPRGAGQVYDLHQHVYALRTKLDKEYSPLLRCERMRAPPHARVGSQSQART